MPLTYARIVQIDAIERSTSRTFLQPFSPPMNVQSIRFCDRISDVDLYKLQALLNKSAFWAIDRRIEDLQMAIDRSEPVISAWDEDKLIGFARANSDGIYRATVFDVVVDPDYRRLGLGRKLVETILMHPCMCRVEKIYLMTTNQQSFYERLGFSTNHSTTMVLDRSVRSIAKNSLDPQSDPVSLT